MAVNIGPRIGIDGEAQFRKEISNLIQQQKTLASELKAVTSAFDKNDKSQEAVSAQSSVLAKQIQLQHLEIGKLKQGLIQATAAFGETDSRTQKWQRSVNKATAQLNRMKSQLSEIESGVDDTGKSMNDAAKEAASFGDVLKANVLSQAIVDGVKELASTAKDMAADFIEAAASVKARNQPIRADIWRIFFTSNKRDQQSGRQQQHFGHSAEWRCYTDLCVCKSIRRRCYGKHGFDG